MSSGWLPRFLLYSVPLYAVLALFSFRGMHAGQSPDQAASVIFEHEYDMLLQFTYVTVCLLLFGAWFWSLSRLRTDRPSFRSVLGVGALLGFISWCAYPGASSNDILAYVAYGRMLGVHHLNPWTHAYVDIHDFYSAYAWYHHPMPYGPMAAPLFALAGSLSEVGVPLAFYFLKLCWLGAFLCSGWLVWRIARFLPGCPVSPEWAAWAWLTNPLMLLELVNNGHCDGLMVTLMLASLHEMLRRDDELHAFSGLLLGGAAMLVKPTAVLLVAAEVVWLLRRRRWRAVLGALAVGGGLTGLLLTTLFATAQARQALANPHELTNAFSFHSVVIRYCMPKQNYMMAYEMAEMSDVRLAVLATFVAICGVRLLRIRTAMDVVREYLWMTLALILVYSARVWPWYLSWLLPFAVVVDYAPLRLGMQVYTATVLADYAVSFRLYGEVPAWHAMRVLIANGIPLLVIAFEAWRSRGDFTSKPDEGINPQSRSREGNACSGP